MFVDYVTISIASGKGGDGAVAFRREKYVPKGGPAGGDGGDGGNVYFIAETNLHTLLDFRYHRKYKAGDGEKGGTSLKDGKNGRDVIIKVPVGTVIRNRETGEILADLDKAGKKFLALKGGKGGKGNSKFATPTNQTPRYAEPGKPGKSLDLILELKLIADVGLVGFPNAGKSTFISTVSAARPKIADYPFTTLKPNLGIVSYKDFQSFTIADIPGIIEGAHEGKGLGLNFLRHIERTKVLFLMLDSSGENLKEDYKILRKELNAYSKKLSEKKFLVGLSKIDLLDAERRKELNDIQFDDYGGEVLMFSSITKEGIEKVLDSLWKLLQESI
jgi:GTP-binding protein